jgi:hypothetical protein
VLDDDGTLTGDYPMPAAYWRLAEHYPIVVRIRAARIPTAPRLAFAGEFQALSDIFGQRHLDLWWLTHHDAYLPEPTPRRDAFDTLTAALPETFVTVVGSCHPCCLFLTVPLSALTEQVADAILAAHAGRQSDA